MSGIERFDFLAVLRRLNPELADRIIGELAQPRPTPPEVLADLPPTAAVESLIEGAAAGVARLVTLAGPGLDVLHTQAGLLLLAQIETQERTLRQCRERDALAATRPDGCWCLGAGGRGPAVVSVELGGTPRALRDGDGEPVAGFREWCECREARERRERAAGLVERARVEHRAAQIARRWGEVGIEVHFSDATLEGWAAAVSERGGDPGPTLGKLEAWLVGTRWLVLSGDYGRGKSGLAAAVMRRLVESGHSALFRTVPDLLGRLRGSYRGDGDEMALLRALYDVDVLVLDDVGADRAPSDWATETLFRVINHRHDAHRRTVLTTNLDLKGLAAHLSERTFERIREMTGREGVLRLDGPNLRDAR